MGANAVTTVFDFTAGQILTAAQMDNVNCGIPVFATTTTRDAAFGGAGEKTLAQGQTCYIEATSSYQTYNGSAWVAFGAGDWISYTPVIKGGATTVTATLQYAKYLQINKIVFVRVQALITSAGAANGIISCTLPINPVGATSIMDTAGSFSIADSGTAYYVGSATIETAATPLVKGYAYNSVDYMGASQPAMTLANNDRVTFAVTYEVA
jgi:hypothetical protein